MGDPFSIGTTVQYFNFYYWLFWAYLLFAVIVSVVLCRRLGKRFCHIYILCILWTNFALHFLKQLTPWYLGKMPFSLSRSSPENLCAVLVMASPFIYLYGGKYGKDYMFYVGILSALVVHFVPTGAIGRDFTDPEDCFEILRFYSCHVPLILTSFLMVEEGLHKLDYHRCWAVAPLWVGVQLIIFLTNTFWKATVVVYADVYWADFFYRMGPENQSCTFGPPEAVDGALGWFYYLLPPYLATFQVGDRLYFTPALWFAGPFFLIVYPIGITMSFPWEHRHMRLDFLALKQKLAMARRARP